MTGAGTGDPASQCGIQGLRISLEGLDSIVRGDEVHHLLVQECLRRIRAKGRSGKQRPPDSVDIPHHADTEE
jgi:hypothetical protein